ALANAGSLGTARLAVTGTTILRGDGANVALTNPVFIGQVNGGTTVTLNLGGRRDAGGTTTGVTLTGPVDNVRPSASVNNTLNVDDPLVSVTISGAVSGTASLNINKTGFGTLGLSGNNTYLGAVNVNAGVLTVLSSNALGQTF